MKIHLLVAAAATAATLATGCTAPARPWAPQHQPILGQAGQVAHTGAGLGKAPATLQAKTTIRQPGETAKAKADADAESLWSGSVGNRSAMISLSMGGWVNASLGNADFNGSTFGSSVSGSLRRPEGTSTVQLNGFSSSMTGRIGRDHVVVSIAPGGWVNGRVGDRRLSLSVSRTVVTGDVEGRRFWLSGTGLDPREDLGFTAALLVLAAAAE